MDSAIQRAKEVLKASSFDVDPVDPFASSILRARRSVGMDPDPKPLVERWEVFHRGSVIGDTRYHWPFSHQRISVPDYAGDPRKWRPWRTLEYKAQFEPYEFETRLSLPISMTECGELLLELRDDPELGSRASSLFEECEPVFRRDYAMYVQAFHPLTDTFALWCLCRRPRMFARLRPLAFAIATCYATILRIGEGMVLGRGFPFHKQPLVSATAHLARALLSLGTDIDLVATMLAWVGKQQNESGGYQDPGGPPDVLTTLASAELLGALNPSFDDEPIVRFLVEKQTPTGTWTVYGPEAPWLTQAALEWLEARRMTFGERFRWPSASEALLDQKTGLPGFARFRELEGLCGAIEGLGASPFDVAFIDLAGFRHFNNSCGQDLGDAVLACFAETLRGLEQCEPIRDGGDEFLLIGAPTSCGLAKRLNLMRRVWPAIFRQRFGSNVSPVAPRILVGRTFGRSLRSAREALGRAIAPLKTREPNPDPEGVLKDLGNL